MVLNCDFCRAEINNNANNDELPPSIYLFPCFHRHCDRCRCAAYQQNGRVVCKVCGCQCLPKHIYDYVETPLDRIYCMFCNIKNRAQVEWRCETCQKSYMCNVCTKPHVVSGHTLTHVKMYVPTHSQCHSHLNLSATYLCSCQTRLCVHCLNIHANGQLVAPHEQRYPFAQLADQARQRIQTIRTNSQREMEKAQKILPVLERNKKFVHEMASKARSAVADQIVELCNALIRRGNDIVTHIDLFEQEKLQKYEAVGTELKRVVDHYRKIEEFSENALVTAQNDHPGMFSASEFAQNSVSLISKKLETLQQDVELTQRLPKISYQSDLTQLIHSIQNLGVVDVDGNKTVPMLTTPQNAKMFTVTNAFVTSQQPGPSAPVTTIRPNLSILNPPVSTVRLGTNLMRPVQNGGQTVMANVTVSAVPTNPFNVPLPPNVGIVQPTQHQQLVNGRIMSASHVPPVHLAPTSVAVTGVLSHLLQQGVSSVVTAANNSQPNTPTTPNFPQVRQPLQHQAVNHHQQQQIIHQQQQNQLALHQQQMTQMQRQQAVRNQQMMRQQQQQQHHFLQQQQQYLQQPQAPQQTHNQTVNIHQNQVLLKQLQAQQQLFQQQQQQQRQFIQQHHSQSQASVSSTPQVLQQNASVSTATDRERRLLLRFPNPFKQQAQQQQIINPVPSGSPIAMPQIASPSQTHQMVQQRGELNPIQQQQVPLRQSQKNPIVVELMDDDEEETDKTNKQKQIIPQNQLSNEDRSILLTSYQQNLKLNHPQISRAAADSTVNAGNGSSDDSSASPCPSSSVPKRPATLPIHVPEPSHKRLAIENSHNITAIDRIALNTEEGSTRSPAISPAISTTMAEGNAKEVENEVQSHGTADDGSASHQTDITLSTCSKHTDNESNQGHREKENIEQSDHCIEEQPQLTSNADQNTELNTVASPPETSEGELQEDDQWDDYCYVCSQGCDETTGSLGCCKTCPKVFHAKCHVPMFSVAMEDLPDDWQCTLCLPCDPLIHLSHSFGKREKLLCAKVYLNCFATFSNVEPFLNAVSTDESDYYAVIREPIWLNKIARKISSGEYKLIAEFVEDMNLLFRNCSTFNLPTNSLSSSGKKVYTLYMEAMREFLPAYEKNIWIYVSLYSTRLSVASSNEDESVRRRYSRRGGQKAKSQTPG